jgi:uncharacterized protein (UPF0548 family)
VGYSSLLKELGKEMRIRQSPRWFALLGLLVVLVLVVFAPVVTGEEKVTWTPNEDAEAPLPLSSNQRQQLLQLEHVIMQSADPTATLNEAASTNGMDPMDLLDLLERNHQSLQEAGELPAGGGGPVTAQSRNVWKIFTSVGVVVAQAASKNPRQFTLLATTMLLVAYIAIAAPRTGLVLSTANSPFSKGATTVWNPPVRYVDTLLEPSSKFISRDVSFVTKKAWKELDLGDESGTVWHGSLRKTKLLQQAASSQVAVPTASFVELHDDQDSDAAAEQQEYILDLCFEHASRVLTDRQLTEFVKPPNSLRLISQKEGRKQHAVLVVKEMGDWGRYGLLPLQVIQTREEEDELSLTLGSLKGSHWDGQIHIDIRKQDTDMVVRVHILVPKKGRKVSRKIAMRIVQGLSESIALSLTTRTKQSLARRSQSSRFQGKFRSRALERRHTRNTKEQEMEEMSEDRRRRWQRSNPDAGRYRPSGDRMKSPENC